MIRAILFLTLASTSVALAGDAVPDLYQQSYALEATYSYERAMNRLDGIPLEGDDVYLVPLRRGWLLHLQGRYEESVAAYDLAIGVEPGALEPRLGRTLPLMALRRWSDAEADCRWILERAPGNYLAESRLAYVLYNAGRHAEAEVAYAHLVAAWPSDVEMRAGLGWALLRQGKTAEARAHLEYVLHLVPDHASAREGLDGL